MKIAILVPSRGRPDRAAAMAESARSTAEDSVTVTVIVDPDEPDLLAYARTQRDLVTLGDRLGFVGSLNHVASRIWDDVDILGAFGDDVAFRTPGWDQRVRETLATPGIAYGDDLIHGANHPTAVFMSSAIAKALGWLAMPATRHQWADDAWKRLGTDLGCLRFMADVVIEHLHPAVGKAPMDATYESVFGANEAASFQAKADFEGFEEWVARYLALDIANVRAAIGGPA